MKKLYIYVDGASRGNPGPAGVGVVIYDEKMQRLKEFNKYLGTTTNNIAEYYAVIYGLQEALIIRGDEIELNLDSELVSRQITGDFKVKNANIKLLFEQILHLMKGFKKIAVKNVKRENNKEADRLANRAINLKGLL